MQSALADTDVPVAKMYHLCEDDEVIGSMFYVMDAIDGRNHTLPTMPDVDNTRRGAVITEMNRVLAALHDVNIDNVGLSDYGAPGNYYERQIGRWTKQYKASETVDVPAMNELMERLVEQMPKDDGQRTLVHGDYRIDNMMFEHDGPNCLAVLDWELSTTGHPYADLAAVIMQWQMPATKEGRGFAGIDRRDIGVPTDEEFIAAYCERRGIGPIDNFGFYLAFNFFRMTGIIQGVLKRALDGNASNPERGIQMGQYVPMFANAGLQALNKG